MEKQLRRRLCPKEDSEPADLVCLQRTVARLHGSPCSQDGKITKANIQRTPISTSTRGCFGPTEDDEDRRIRWLPREDDDEDDDDWSASGRRCAGASLFLDKKSATPGSWAAFCPCGNDRSPEAAVWRAGFGRCKYHLIKCSAGVFPNATTGSHFKTMAPSRLNPPKSIPIVLPKCRADERRCR